MLFPSYLSEADRGRRDDVVDARAPGQIADRLGESLQKRTDRLGSSHVLRQLVSDVARVEVGEDERIRPAGHFARLFNLFGHLPGEEADGNVYDYCQKVGERQAEIGNQEKPGQKTSQSAIKDRAALRRYPTADKRRLRCLQLTLRLSRECIPKMSMH